ncbi:hypothetical protein C922_00909 [Plasmodium inui San Antonio 1]|uniref:Uncharacterized protein n=1 Tax=Plasmodium inui San Antonio 1 TaxID=1237626 RepID=W7AB74_9APIC|nr:hypothetical protein C922_00909 [Plasmodium inui San Antonio 1]EUD68513.1 hypothetical protein C922_00909 [Plasmodium inui San Antonio 1]
MKTFALLHKLQVHKSALQEDEREGVVCFFSLCVSNGFVYVGSSNGRIFLFKRKGPCLFEPVLFYSVIRSQTSGIVTKIFAVDRLHLLIHGTDKGGIYILESKKLARRKCFLSTEREKKKRVRRLVSPFHKGAITSINCVVEEDLRCRRGRSFSGGRRCSRGSSGGSCEGETLYVFVGDQQGILSCIVLKKKGSRVRSEANILLIDKTNGPIGHVEIERDIILVTCERVNVIMNVEDVIDRKVNFCTIGKKENRSYYRSVFCNSKGRKGGCPFILSLRKNGRVWLSHGERVINTLVFYYSSVYFFYLFFKAGVTAEVSIEVSDVDSDLVSDGIRRGDRPDGGGTPLPFHLYVKQLIKNVHFTTLLKKILTKFKNFLLPLRPNANVCYKIDKDHFLLFELANPFRSFPSGSPDACAGKLPRNDDEEENLAHLRKDIDLIRSFIEKEMQKGMENGREDGKEDKEEDEASGEKTKCLSFLMHHLDDAENILRRIKSKKIMVINIRSIEIEEMVDLHVGSLPWGCNERGEQERPGETHCTSNKSNNKLGKQEGEGTQGKIPCGEENLRLSPECVSPKGRDHMDSPPPNESQKGNKIENKTHRRIDDPFWKYFPPNQIIDSVKWKKKIFLLYFNPNMRHDFYVAQNISDVFISPYNVTPGGGVHQIGGDTCEGKAQEGTTHFYLCEVHIEDNFELAKYLPHEIEKVTHLEGYSFHMLLFHVSHFFDYLNGRRDSLDPNFLFHVEKDLLPVEEAHCLDDQISQVLLKNIEAVKKNIKNSLCVTQRVEATGSDFITDNNFLQGVDLFRSVYAPVNPAYLHVNVKKAKKLYSRMRSAVVKYMPLFCQVVTCEVFPDTPLKGHLPCVNNFDLATCVTLIRSTPHLLFQFLHYFHIFVYLEVVITSCIYRENYCFRKFPLYVPERRLGGGENPLTPPSHIDREVEIAQTGTVNRLRSYAAVQLKGADNDLKMLSPQFGRITSVTSVVRPNGGDRSGRIGYDAFVDAGGGCWKKRNHLFRARGETYKEGPSSDGGNTFDLFDNLRFVVKGLSKKGGAMRETLSDGVPLPRHATHLSKKELFFQCNRRINRQGTLRNVLPLLHTLYLYRRWKRSIVAKVGERFEWPRRPCRKEMGEKVRRRGPPQMNRLTRLFQAVGRTQRSPHAHHEYVEQKQLRNNGKNSCTQFEERKGRSPQIRGDVRDEGIQRQQIELRKILTLRKLLKTYMENASCKKGILKDQMTIQDFLKCTERLYFYRKVTEGVYIINLNEYRQIYECLFLYELFVKLFDTEIVLFRLHPNCKVKMEVRSKDDRGRGILWRTSLREGDQQEEENHQKEEKHQHGMVNIVGNKQMQFFQKWNEHIIRNDILLMDILFGFYYNSEGSSDANLKSFVRKFSNFGYLAEYVSYVRGEGAKGGEAKGGEAKGKEAKGAMKGVGGHVPNGTSFLFSFDEAARKRSEVDMYAKCAVDNPHGGGLSRAYIVEKRLDGSRTQRSGSTQEVASPPHGKPSCEQNCFHLPDNVEAKRGGRNHLKKAKREEYRLHVETFLRAYTHLEKKHRCTRRQRGVNVFLFFKNIDVYNFVRVVYLLCRERYHHELPLCAGREGRHPNGDPLRKKKPIWNSREVSAHIGHIVHRHEESSGLKKVSSAFRAFVKDLMVGEGTDEPHLEILNQRSVELCLQYVRHLIKGQTTCRHSPGRKKKMSLLVCKLAHLLRMLNWRRALSSLLDLYRSLSCEVFFFTLLWERHCTELGGRAAHLLHRDFSTVLKKNRSYEDVVMHMLLHIGRNSGYYFSIMIMTILKYFFEDYFFLKNVCISLEDVITRRYSSLFLCFFKNGMFKRECIFSPNLFQSFHTSDSFFFSGHSFVKYVFKRCYTYMNFQSGNFLTVLNNLLYDHLLKLFHFFQVNCSSSLHVHFCFFLLISYFYVGYYAPVYPLLRFFWDTFCALLPKLQILNCKEGESQSCVLREGREEKEEEEEEEEEQKQQEEEAPPTGHKKDTKFSTQRKRQKDVIPSEESLLHSIDYLANFFFEMLIKFLWEVNHKVCSKDVDLVIHNIRKNEEVYLKASEFVNNFYGSCALVCSRCGENGLGETFHKQGSVTCRRKNISVQIYDRRGRAHTLVEMLNSFFGVLCCLQTIKLSLKKRRAVFLRTNRHYRKYLLGIICGLFGGRAEGSGAGGSEERGEGCRCSPPSGPSTNGTSRERPHFQLDRLAQRERSLSVLTCALCIAHFVSHFKHIKGELIRKFIFMLDYFLANHDSPNFEQQHWGYTPQKNIHQIYKTIITNLPTRVLPVK